MTTIETVYRFTHDRAAVNALLRDQKKIDAALEDTEDAAHKTASAFTDAEKTSLKASSAQQTAAAASLNVAKKQTELVGATGSRLSALGGLASGLGGSALSSKLMLGADLLDATEAAKLMSAELPALTSQLGLSTAALGVGAVAVGALAVGLSLLSKAASDSREQVQQTIDFEKTRTQVLQDVSAMTTDQIQERIAALHDESLARQQEISRLQIAREELAGSMNVIEQLGEATGIANQGVDDYNKRLKELTKEQDSATTEIILLNKALENQTTAANDTAAAEDKLAAQRLSMAQKDFARYQEVYSAEDTMTEDQLDARLKALAREKQAIEDSGLIYEKAGRDRAVEIDILTDWLEISRPVIQARDTETAALKAQTDALETATKSRQEELSSIVELRQDRRATNNDLLAKEKEYGEQSVALEVERERKSLEEQADFSLQRTRDLADHYADMAEQDAAYYSQRADILQGLQDDLDSAQQDRDNELYALNRDLEKLAKDHATQMRQIARDSDRAIRSDALRLDAIGIYEEQQRRRDELEAAEDQYQDQKAEREQQYRDALRLLDQETTARRKQAAQALKDLDTQHAQERTKNEAAFQQRLQREDQDRALRLQRQSEQYAREDAARLATYNTQLAELQTHAAQVEKELQAHYDRLYAIHVSGMSKLESGPPGGPGGLVPTYDSGGYTPHSLVRTQPGEFVLDPATTRLAERGVGQRLTQQNVRQVFTSQIIGGTTIQIPGNNLTVSELQRAWDRWFDQKMQRMAHS